MLVGSTEVGQSLLRVVMSYALDKPTVDESDQVGGKPSFPIAPRFPYARARINSIPSEPLYVLSRRRDTGVQAMAAVRYGLMRCVREGAASLSEAADTTLLHEPLCRLTLRSHEQESGWPYLYVDGRRGVSSRLVQVERVRRWDGLKLVAHCGPLVG